MTTVGRRKFCTTLSENFMSEFWIVRHYWHVNYLEMVKIFIVTGFSFPWDRCVSALWCQYSSDCRGADEEDDSPVCHGVCIQVPTPHQFNGCFNQDLLAFIWNIRCPLGPDHKPNSGSNRKGIWCRLVAIFKNPNSFRVSCLNLERCGFWHGCID